MITPLRHATQAELDALSALAMASKAVHGYDADFMDACRPALTYSAADLAAVDFAVTRDGAGGFIGMVGVALAGAEAELEALFVRPDRIGSGIGRRLYISALAQARKGGAERLWIASDPGAVAFYRRMGARDAGQTPSDAIPGRMLPRLCHHL